MSRTTSYDFPITVICDDYLQLRLTFTHEETGTSYVYQAKDKGLMVTKWGDLSWEYDLEDALLVPANLDLEVNDYDFELHNLLFGEAYPSSVTNKDFQVELKINGSTEFLGNATEDSISYNETTRTLRFRAKPKTDILNETMVYDFEQDNPTSLNPFGYTDGSRVGVTKIIEDIYKLVDPSVSYSSGKLEVMQNWIFKGNKNDDETYWYDQMTFTQLRMGVGNLYFNNAFGIRNVADVLRQLAVEFGCFTGMIHSGKAFFKKLFYYDPNNLQTFDLVINHKINYKYSKIRYVEAQYTGGGFPNQVTPTTFKAGTYTELKKAYLKKNLANYFLYEEGLGRLTTAFVTVTNGGPEDGVYWVLYAKDPSLDNTFKTNVQLIADFWYNYRGNISRCRVDEFNVMGLGHDFLKDFNYKTSKFQPIKMRKQLSKGTTNIEALYLGEL